MADRLGFELFVDDNGSANVTKFGTAMKKAAADLESAQVRVAKATQVAGTATEKYGKDSLQARDAVAKLHQAEVAAEAATNKHAAAQKTSGVQIEEATKKTGKLSGALQQAGSTMAGVFGAQVVTAGLQKFQSFASDSVEAASSLGESMNAVQKVFGDNAKTITDWGAKSAASYGLSQSAFNEMATPLGSGLKNAGLSMQDTSKWTIDLTKRASDMASVFNTSVPDALEAIQAGLRGEADPLERYGVGLSAAAVQAEALTETHKKAASSLTNTELATARLNLIMKQTASTAGDFASTSDGLANAQRKASAEMENAKAKLGGELLPIMAKVTSVTAEAVGGFASLPGPVQKSAVALVAVGGAATLLLPKVMAVKNALGDLGMTKGKLTEVAGAIGVIGAELAVFKGIDFAVNTLKDPAPGLNTTVKALQELQMTGKSTGPVLSDIGDAFKDLGASEAGARGILEGLPGFFNVAERATGSWSKSIADSKDQVSQLDQALALEVSSGNAGAASVQFQKLTDTAKAQGLSVDELGKLFPNYKDAVDAAGLAATLHAGATSKDTTAIDREKAALDKATASMLANASAKLQGRGDEVGYWASVDASTQALKDNGKTLDVHTEKGRANRTVLDQQASSALAWLQDLQNSGTAGAAFDATVDSMRKRLYDQAIQFGATRGEARTYADQMLNIPHQAPTTATFNKAGAQATGSGWVSFLRQIPTSVNTKAGFDISAAMAARNRWVAALRSTPSSVNGTMLFTGSATGGRVPGSPSSVDTEPYLLSKGEFVVNSHATSQNLATLEAINSGSGRRGFAAGGYVGLRPSGGGTVVNINVANQGVLGSEADVRHWFAETWDFLSRTNGLGR